MTGFFVQHELKSYKIQRDLKNYNTRTILNKLQWALGIHLFPQAEIKETETLN